MADEIDLAKAQKKRAKARKEWLTFGSRVVAQVVGAAASVALGVYIVQRGQQADDTRAAASASTPAPVRVETPRRSGEVAIAVLPLSNYSADPQQEYFADGMTEALTAELAQIKGLRVISRTSVMQYKNTRKSFPR